MRIVADLHIHSRHSRACSRDLVPENLHRWCQLKGVAVLGTGDFTHPGWMGELAEKLEPAEPGLLRLKPSIAARADEDVPPSCRAQVRFLLEAEVSCIYKRAGRVRKVHHLAFVPTMEAAARLSKRLASIGNLRSDGRPILGLDSRDLLELVREASDEACLVPAHAWTPHFSVFGSESGFDSLEECFGDLADHVFAIETGLSSDPPMNWRVSRLDRLALVSNSDAHSPEKLAREANVLDAELSYRGIFEALRSRDPARFPSTIEFFPEEGKYHVDGHRACKVRLRPEETEKLGGLCPSCGRPVTVGVLHRVEDLADRPEGVRPRGAAGCERLIPLKEVLAEVLRVGSSSRRVDAAYHRLLASYGCELRVLREVPLDRIEAGGDPVLAVALGRMREGEVAIEPGYDGEYGKVALLRDEDFSPSAQPTLF